MKLLLLISLLIAPFLRATPITLQNAGASFSQTGFSAAATTDGLFNLSNGWAVSPQVSATNRIWWSTPALGSSTQARCADFPRVVCRFIVRLLLAQFSVLSSGSSGTRFFLAAARTGGRVTATAGPQSLDERAIRPVFQQLAHWAQKAQFGAGTAPPDHAAVRLETWQPSHL